ncbi:MAG: hypothetical protein E7079_02425 [Bacteroidales bacterium]|nr:hypothetical protein [Bacteroidales bacterium]
MKNFKIVILTLCAVLSLSSCSDDDPEQPVLGKNLWGEVLRGDNMQLQFYPDHFAFYWEYTFDAEANPEIGLIIEGEFPNARFLSYNVYDDEAQTSYCEKGYSLTDVEIEADNGYINTFRQETTERNQKYTIYVLPTDAPDTYVSDKANICWFDADVKKVCTMLRYYIPEGGINGGVEMPRIKAINLTTGKELDAPARIMSGIRGEMELPGAAFTSTDNALFFRAPFSYAYPNGPSEYCYSRNILEENKVIVFNFKAPTYPKTVSEFATADMRYWSVCVGNAETYTPLAISDYQTKIDVNGFANYILADKNAENYAEVKKIANEKGYNILEWDGKAWGEGVMILYRNMLFDENYPHSMRLLDPVGPNVNVMEDPAKYIAVMKLGPWGATGRKITTDEFISCEGNVVLRQQ